MARAPEGYDFVMVDMGGRGRLDNAVMVKMSTAPAMTHFAYPKATIMLTMRGYDDDPRELWQIPEVAAYIKAFARIAGLRDWRSGVFRALDEGSKALLIACDAIDKPHPFHLTAPGGGSA